MFLQFLINGLITGCIYSLASISFALVYYTTHIFHIALAVLYVLAAYVFWYLTVALGIPVFVSLLISLFFTSAVSFGIERYVYYPLHKAKSSLNVVMVSSIGVFIVVTNIIAMIWSNETKTFSSDISKVFSAGNIIITARQAMQFIGSTVLIILFFVALNFSRAGLRIKAVRDDAELFQVIGFSLTGIRRMSFLLSGFLIGAASCLTAMDIGMDPYVGMPILLNAIVALIIGGMGRFESCIIGGLSLGILQALVVWKWSAQWQEAITFLILIIFLFMRPQGLIGERSRLA
ncbi:MAG TPA: branched-chain amino acid ABC transporter permease [Bacteroidales bacterium]|jgi:branched-chain amino acid transport system permease protein|nr:branched-chain amino acid ABC transporter permease [Bacteroidales bacterium]